MTNSKAKSRSSDGVSTHTSHVNKQSLANEKSSRVVANGRIMFLLCLLIMAAVLSTVFYFVLRTSETELAENQYESIADRALDTAYEILRRKRLGTISMASVSAYANPDAGDWPFVVIEGYEDIATNLIETSAGREMGFCPLVTLDQLESFEDFAYKFYYEDRNPPFPNTTAVSEFGRGVWGAGPEGRYKAADATPTYENPNRIFAPIFHHNEGAHPALLINLRFEETRRTEVDNIIECSKQKEVDVDVQCGAITGMIILTSQEVEPGPGALIMQPIYPANDKTMLTGIIASSIVWDEILVNVFSSEVSGIVCFLEIENQVYTYSIENGEANLLGEGRITQGCHGYSRFIKLSEAGDFSSTSANYTLSLCPTDLFFDSYRTTNPGIAAFGAAMCIVVTSMLFILYDSYVKREFNTKIELLEAKRKFVRFVSHEVRTPLNSVCMGLSVIQEEIGAALGLHPEDGKLHGSHEVDARNATEWLSLSKEIMENAQASVDVLDDLLNYDKVEMGTLSLEYTIIPIWKLVEATTKEFKLPCSAKNISLSLAHTSFDVEVGSELDIMSNTLDQSTKDMKVVGDNVRIKQVLRNLISNAVKFTKDSGQVSVKTEFIEAENPATLKTKDFTLLNGEDIAPKQCGTLQVSVTDTGAGMSTEQLASLFRNGVQFNVNALQAGQGSGLGLYITKGIVEQHGGDLHVSSKGLGCGTTFTMLLPLFHIPDKSIVKPSPQKDLEQYFKSDESAEKLLESQLQSPYLRVLVVDDAPMNRKLLRRILQNHGHTIDDAEDGLEALDKVDTARKEGNPFDSILLDYEMPRMNGPDACKEMRRRGCDSFIVGVTGNLLEEDVVYFKACGANGVLPKPFRLQRLDELWQEYGVIGGVPTDSPQKNRDDLSQTDRTKSTISI